MIKGLVAAKSAAAFAAQYDDAIPLLCVALQLNRPITTDDAELCGVLSLAYMFCAAGRRRRRRKKSPISYAILEIKAGDPSIS